MLLFNRPPGQVMPDVQTKRVLVAGAAGQIGSELTLLLRDRYGGDNVVAMGRKTRPSAELADSGPFVFGDVTDLADLERIIREHDIDTVYLMAAILSAVGEANPQLAYRVNMDGLYNSLELGRELGLKLFCPSSIAVFGPGTPLDNTPQETVLKPTTMYGVTKVAGELLCDYYNQKFEVDIRGIRYPGIISNATLPGGGTTDYAVAIYYEALKARRYECFVAGETRLPMMYMPDALKATLDLMESPRSSLKHNADYNLGAMSFSAEELADSITELIPDFQCTFKPDFRQAIADSWPNSVDDSAARREWGWQPDYDLPAMTRDMLEVLSAKLDIPM